jgi:dihydrofolate reductase
LADLGLIDEYEFLVLPVVAGHGPTLFAGLSERLELTLVGRQEVRVQPRASWQLPRDERVEPLRRHEMDRSACNENRQ